MEGMIPKEITAIVTVLCSQWVVNERGEVVLQNDHPAAGDYARAVAISELYCKMTWFLAQLKCRGRKNYY